MYITAEELEEYVKKYPEDESLVKQYTQAAEEMIEKYLGYSPELKLYETTRYGDNGKLFELDSFPLRELQCVSVNGNEIDSSLFRMKSKNYIEYNYGKGVFSSDSLYSFKYTAGWEVKTTEENTEPEKKRLVFEKNEVPAKIRTVALQIASLMWESEGGNIAVSSTSYADNGSRVFNNFKADRFLDEIKEFRLGLEGGF